MQTALCFIIGLLLAVVFVVGVVFAVVKNLKADAKKEEELKNSRPLKNRDC